MSLLANSNAIEDAGYKIQRSLRFRSSASAYLSRTPASASNRTIWTYSTWTKRGQLGSSFFLLDATAGVGTRLYFNSSDQLEFDASGAQVLVTSAVFRDPSAYYHIILSVDTTQATAANRVKLSINGAQVTAFSVASYPAQNASLDVNNNVAHYIGRNGNASSGYFDGYLAEVNFIDGQALTPSSFGQTDPVTGVWTPKKYTGTYGTNGFYLPFSDNTSATTLAYDKSGNGNNWTANNISTTAGVTYDSMLDVPTLTSATAANFAVMNPLHKSGSPTISNANLRVSDGTATETTCIASMSTGSSGKYYFECTMVAVADSTAPYGSNMVGLIDAIKLNGMLFSSSYRSGGNIYNLSGTAQTSGESYTANDIIGVAVDVTNGTIQYYKNNVAQGSTPSVTFTAGTELWPYVRMDNITGTKTFDLNFGQRPFSYTPPTGFKALNTFNLLSTTAITTSGTFTGNGSADGPFVYLNGVPTAMTINGNAVTFATHADKLANGFKVRTTSSSYNNSGVSNSYSITTTGAKFKYANAQGNP